MTLSAQAEPESIRNSRRTDWTAISTCIAMTSLLLVIVPPWFDRWFLEPKADFTSGLEVKRTFPVHDQDSVPTSFDLSGTSANIPMDQDVWVIVRATTEGRWYPTARVTGDHWMTQELAIRMATGKQELYLYMVSIAQERPLVDYVQALRIGRTQQVENDNGLSALPVGKVLQKVRITAVRSTKPAVG